MPARVGLRPVGSRLAGTPAAGPCRRGSSARPSLPSALLHSHPLTTRRGLNKTSVVAVRVPRRPSSRRSRRRATSYLRFEVSATRRTQPLSVLNLCPRLNLGSTSEDPGVGVQRGLTTKMRIQHP
jgi:hypothetical protein